VTRRGRLITCHVSMSPLHRDKPVGAIMLMEIAERAQ
jgi:hypothetical protein